MSTTSEGSTSYLVVDDDQVFCDTLARSIASRGYQAVTAYDASSALASCADNKPQRAIIDLKLGEASGLHLVEKLKALDPNLEIVVLTGYSSIPTAVTAIKLGARNYLSKPAGINEILAMFEQETDTPSYSPPEAPPSVNRVEWEHIQRVLNEHDGNISATARALGMHRRTLQRKLQKRPVQR